MSKIDAAPIFRLATGDTIHSVRTSGKVQIGQSKEGPLMAAYGAGSVLLAGAEGEVICGPVDLAGAESLALAVLARNPRALTQPQTALSLALALVTLIHQITPQADAAAKQEVA